MRKILSLIVLTIALMVGSSAFAATKDAQYYYNMGQEWEMKNNRPGSVIPYTKALQLDPDCDSAREARAQNYYFAGKYAEALNDFNYFYNKTPKYGPSAFYDFRINSKIRLGLYEAALDDMYETILVYGGHAKVLTDMAQLAQAHPELQYKLSPASHPELNAKYADRARALRDYAQMYKDSEGKVINEGYYNFFIAAAQAIDPYVCLYVDRPTALPRTAPAEGQTIDATIEQK